MEMAMELVGSRSPCLSRWRACNSKVGASLPSRKPLRVSAGRRRFQVRATEEAVESGEKSKASQNFARPPQQPRKWTGYVEKDTAAQSNIYAVEPTVYVADSAFSTNEAGGTPGEGATNIIGAATGLGLVALVGAAAVLLTVTNNAPVSTTAAVGYSGPPLSYYIAKFSPEVAQASVAPEP